MRISDWSSDVCSSDLLTLAGKDFTFATGDQFAGASIYGKSASLIPRSAAIFCGNERMNAFKALTAFSTLGVSSLLNRTGNSTQVCLIDSENDASFDRSEEHTSALQSQMRISYAVFC